MTIPEAVERFRPGPVRGAKTAELVRYPFEHVIQGADLIVQGTVTVRRTYLSEDQTEVYTDYAVIPTAIVAQKAVALRKPAVMPEIIIKKWGGELTVNGVEVQYTDSTVPALPTDVPLVLFLKANADGTYRMPGDAPGAFEVRAAKVRALMTPPLDGERFEDQRLDTFIAFVREVRAKNDSTPSPK